MMRQRWRIAVAVGLVGAARPLHSTATSRTVSPLQVFVEPGAGPGPLVGFIHGARTALDGEVYLASSKPVLAVSWLPSSSALLFGRMARGASTGRPPVRGGSAEALVGDGFLHSLLL